MIPPSMRDGYQYQFCVCSGNISGMFIDPGRLPIFSSEWRPDRSETSEPRPGVKNVVAYLDKIPIAEGQRDVQTYKACRILIEADVPVADATAIIIDWQQRNCQKPWSAFQILDKVRRVYAED